MQKVNKRELGPRSISSSHVLICKTYI